MGRVQAQQPACLSQVFARAPQTAAVFWMRVPWHRCHKQGWCPSPTPCFVNSLPERLSLGAGWLQESHRPSQAQAPSASSPGCGVSAVLHGSHSPSSQHPRSSDVVSKQWLLPVGQRVPWAGDHAHGMQDSAERKVGKNKRMQKVHQKVQSSYSATAVPNFYPRALACVVGIWQDGKGELAWAPVGWMGDVFVPSWLLLSYCSDSEKL